MVDSDEVNKIANLARLELSGEECEEMKTKLNSTLDYIGQLQELDVSEREAMSHVHGSFNVFREDVESVSAEPAELLANAPDRSGTYIRVPLIIEQEFDS